MKKFLFKILKKYVSYFEDEIIDFFIEEQLPSYKIDKNNVETLEHLAGLYSLPEFKLFIKLQSNKKNFLGKKALTLKYKDVNHSAIQLAFLKGQAYDITHSIRTIKYLNKLYAKKRSGEDDK